MKVYRYTIPVDAFWHDFTLSGPVVHVACRNDIQDVVHFWVLEGAGTPFTARLRIYGTGQDVPLDTMYRGTAIAEPLVWHLFEQAS